MEERSLKRVARSSSGLRLDVHTCASENDSDNVVLGEPIRSVGELLELGLPAKLLELPNVLEDGLPLGIEFVLFVGLPHSLRSNGLWLRLNIDES